MVGAHTTGELAGVVIAESRAVQGQCLVVELAPAAIKLRKIREALPHRSQVLCGDSGAASCLPIGERQLHISARKDGRGARRGVGIAEPSERLAGTRGIVVSL